MSEAIYMAGGEAIAQHNPHNTDRDSGRYFRYRGRRAVGPVC